MARQKEERGVPKEYTVRVHGGCRHVYRSHVCYGMQLMLPQLAQMNTFQYEYEYEYWVE